MATDVTGWLHRLSEGDAEALDHLVPLLYDELRTIARGWLRKESPGNTLRTTALVNEAYLRLLGERRIEARDRDRFFAVAAKVMRRILVDAARRRKAAKRGGGAANVPYELVAPILADEGAADLLELDEALQRLAALSPRAVQVVEHRVFAGRSVEETAAILQVSEKTVQRDWVSARAWLGKELLGSEG